MELAETYDLLAECMEQLRLLVRSSLSDRPTGEESGALLRLVSFVNRVSVAEEHLPSLLKLEAAFEEKRAGKVDWYTKAFWAFEGMLPNAQAFANASYLRERLACVSAASVADDCQSWSALGHLLALTTCRRLFALREQESPAIHLECRRLAAQKDLPSMEVVREVCVAIGQELTIASGHVDPMRKEPPSQRTFTTKQISSLWLDGGRKIMSQRTAQAMAKRGEFGDAVNPKQKEKRYLFSRINDALKDKAQFSAT